MDKHEKRGVCVWLFCETTWAGDYGDGAYLFDDEASATAWQLELLEKNAIIERVGELWNFVDDPLDSPVCDEHIIDHFCDGLTVIEWFHVKDVFVQTTI